MYCDMVPHQHTSIPSHAFPTPSPSPPWDRGLNQHPFIAVTPPPPLPPSAAAAAAAATLLTPTASPASMAQLVYSSPQMVILPASSTPGGKDSRWLTLEVCREFQRSKCSRSDTECKFAHPPPHVEIQNGRVVACFDSIKGKCQRKDPPCKYLHPPQHLREQLLQNGRNNLILKNLQVQAYQTQYANIMPMAYEPGAKTVTMSAVMPGQYSYLTHYPGLQALSTVPGQPPTATYSPYLTSFASVPMPGGADPNSVMSQGMPANMIAAKAVRADKFETSADNGEAVTSHTSLMESFSYPTYITQTPGAAAMPHPMVIAKKRSRDPTDDLLLQSAVPGMMPAYKRIAIGDISKGGYPVYQTNPMMSPLQHTSLMHLQQQPSYIPMSYTYLYPHEAPHAAAPTAYSPHHLTALGPSMYSMSPAIATTSAANSNLIASFMASTSMAGTSSTSSSSSSGDSSGLVSASGLGLYMMSKSSHSSSISNNITTSAHGATHVPSIPNNAYHVEYFGSNKQIFSKQPVAGHPPSVPRI